MIHAYFAFHKAYLEIWNVKVTSELGLLMDPQTEYMWTQQQDFEDLS